MGVNGFLTDNRIPVTIVTGFLGAGKTTLLNNIIGKYPDKRFAVIENEIGETGIDGGLIVAADENIFELNNGCICCSLNGDFNDVILRLTERAELFDHLLIETTGIADPSAVVQSFFSSEFIQRRFRVDCVVCLADAINLRSCIDSEPEARKQLALADIIMVNKTECVGMEELHSLLLKIDLVNPSAKTLQVSYADISDTDLLGIHSYSADGIEKAALSFRNLCLVKSPHDIQTVGIAIPGCFDSDKFHIWMEQYLFFNAKDVFRIKGILNFNKSDRKLVFQAVASSFVIEEGSLWNGEPRFNKLVFIGRKLNREDLEWALHRLVAR